ncbi:Protein SIP5 [Sphaceloma murrayae]|uniref:Protein SIP5 n=1 Tax=Sphaceloma murrayae TaxID=2082308 RepID=A0A2K1QLT7_9PEZI|nr:Protein SIP5 [Sphaceloma murrayae]
MRFSLLTAAVVALAAEGAIASTWFSKAAYNKWHENELERWLSDHDVAYPTPADRKDLVDLVNKNWEENVARPYNSWDTNQLQKYLSSQGKQVQKGAEKNKDSLVSQVKSSWTETTDQASNAFSSVQDWIFDSWTDSQLKAFLDYNKIPNPTPRNRDSLLQAARGNYQTVADKLKETTAYPGNWLYSAWSDSELKAWLDERGIPVPQSGNRDKLIASIRRNSRVASTRAGATVSSLSSSAAAAQATLTDQLINSWDDLKLKKWLDEQGIPIPQGSRKNELQALVRKQRGRLAGNVQSSASSAYGAATTSAGNAVAQATGGLYNQGKQWYDWAMVQIGIGSEEAKSSMSSISSAASSYASSLGSVADKSASSASSAALKTSGDAVAAAKSARAEATKSASSASRAASVSAKAATASVKNEL